MGENGESTQGMVPSSRLREESAAKREALARVAALEAQVQGLEATASEVEPLREQLAATQSARAEDRAVFASGFRDPDLVRFEHRRIPEGDRPKLADWLTQIRDEPDRAPVSLRTVLEPPKDPPPPPKDPPPMGAERPSGSGAPPGPVATPEAAQARLVDLARDATRTGDWSEYNKERAGLLARISRRT